MQGIAPAPLTRREIAERMESIAAEMVGADGEGEAQPRFITAADLVRRMRRFVVLN